MAIKHKIVINVSDPNGRKANVLRGADVKLPARLLKFLLKVMAHFAAIVMLNWFCWKIEDTYAQSAGMYSRRLREKAI